MYKDVHCSTALGIGGAAEPFLTERDAREGMERKRNPAKPDGLVLLEQK